MVTRATFWDDYARLYDTIWNSPATSAICASVAQLIGTPKLIVDLGCGTGLLTQGWTQSSARVIGVDTSRVMLDRALSNRRISEAIQNPAERVSLPNGIADAVLVGNLLHVHANPAAVLAEARRLLRPGGVLAVTWPVPGLTPAGMLRADLASGRGLLPSVGANILRLWVGLQAGSERGPVAERARGDRDVVALEALILAHGPAVDLGVVAGCERVVAF
jgi:SAM-dependent methyltransferase